MPTTTGIWRVPLTGGKFELLANQQGLIHSFQVSPDERRIAYSYATFADNGESAGWGLVVIDDNGGGFTAPDRLLGPWLADSQRLALPWEQDGVAGLAVIDVDAVRDGEPDAFFAASGGTGWFRRAIALRADGALLVWDQCCQSADGALAEEGDAVQLLLDPASGATIERRAYGAGNDIVGYDASGAHPLVAGEPDTGECDHYCPSALFRIEGRTLVPIRDGVLSAAW